MSVAPPPTIPDLFISYAREDGAHVDALVRVFEQQGWSVWWDRDLMPGPSYRKAIREKLDGARCVVVLWSTHSIDSGWVVDEASAGLHRGVLVPVQLEAVSPPLGFGGLETARLADWDGSPTHPGAVALLRGVAAVLGRPAPVDGPTPGGVNWRRWITGAALVSPPLAAAALSAMPLRSVEITADLKASRFSFTLPTDAALLTSAVALDSLAITGLREFRVAAVRYEQPVVLLGAHAGNPGGTIKLEMPVLSAGTRITMDSAGSFVATDRGLRFTFEGTVPELGCTLNGPVQIVVPDIPASMRRDARHDRVVAYPASGVVDIDLLLTAGSAPSFATLHAVEALEFSRPYKISEGERRADPVISTIASGTVSFPRFRRAAQSIAAADGLAFTQSRGSLRVTGLSDGQIALTFAGSVEGLRAGALEMPTLLEWVFRRHVAVLAVVTVLYAIAAGVVLLGWKRRIR